MIELIKDFPFYGQYVFKDNKIDIKAISKSKSSTLYFVEPDVTEEFLNRLKKLLERKRVYTIYIESLDNQVIKDFLKNHPKKHMISYIYDFRVLTEHDTFTIYDYIYVDLEGNPKYYEKLLKFSERVPCIYLLQNVPDMSNVKSIPGNFRFEYETDK